MTRLTADSASLVGQINPGGENTTYHVDYGPTASYGQSSAESGSVGSDNANHSVTPTISGLQAATTYHYRIVATNDAGTVVGPDATFTTHPAPTPAAIDICPNADRRWGPSAALPDCRAYELVTPRDTNEATPRAGTGLYNILGDLGSFQVTPPVSPDGNRFLFNLAGTVLTGYDTNAVLGVYRADRGADGWKTSVLSPNTSQDATFTLPGGATPDFGYTTFIVEGPGSFNFDPTQDQSEEYLRHPDGGFTLLGAGTIPVNPDTDGYPDGRIDDAAARSLWITPDGSHVVLTTEGGGNAKVYPLTADAPPAGIAAIYDRTPTGLKLASLLPGDVTPAGRALYEGVSADGSVIAFSDESTQALYARINGTETKLIATGQFGYSGPDQAGWVTRNRILYIKSGDLYRYDLRSDETTRITNSGDAAFVRVSEDGSRVFFVSRSQLDGANGAAGDPNLYMWDGSIHFIATVRNEDLLNSFIGNPYGLTRWTGGTVPSPPSSRGEQVPNTSRATDDGSVFVFESTADITGQNPYNRNAVYRYTAATGQTTCVSCPTDGTIVTADARLSDHTLKWAGLSLDLYNLTADGQTVFFEADQDLTPGDGDGTTGVYEWHAGKLSLLSSGHSMLGDHLVGASRDGSQVFIETTDQLVSQPQQPGVPAIYSVREGGGFLPPASLLPCTGDGCRDSVGSAGELPAAGSSTFTGPSPGAPIRAAGAATRVSIVKKRASGSRILLTLKVPAAGRIRVSGARIRTLLRSIGEAGTYTVKVHLAAKDARALRSGTRLKVVVRVLFAPTAGKSSSTSAAMTLRLKTRHARLLASRRGALR